MTTQSSNLQHGMSLIEAMIALLVLTIGLVGLGALMLTSMKNVHSSAHYSVASAIVLDLEEQLWFDITRTAVSSPTTGCISDTAIGARASAVVTEWEAAAAGGEGAWSDANRFKMPGISLAVGTTTVSGVDKDADGVDDVSWKTVPVTLSWDEGRFSADQTSESYTANITLPCRPNFLNL
ncbi:hypothetical protein G4Y73_01040 [Wenzhouxiangella sp. XN201]|uniref:type IV pilus modification PilV family protein n=1 Tax=Wenzhouxiangella sp. XN201 TaxID=2710755 RepID=UPI0013CD7130|nr:prepilin-type N-terminal cleavage/methylation domain-containing protein [Wenzhouxiangella sp. XN201]NEZ02730.1 hypothetical protein [Wenzhouxiangella sp. XN201]